MFVEANAGLSLTLVFACMVMLTKSVNKRNTILFMMIMILIYACKTIQF